MPVKGLCDAWAILERNNHDVWIMFSVGSVSQHYWPIYRPTLNWYIGQVSAKCVDQYTADVSQQSVKCQLNIGQASVDMSASECVSQVPFE